MTLPASGWLIGLGAFGAAVCAAAFAAGADGARIAGALGVPVAATLVALLAARAARIDRAVGRALYAPVPDPAAAVHDLVACAEAARRAGPAGLAHVAAEQTDPLLTDGLRLIALGASPVVLRETLERRMEGGVARVFHRARARAAVCAVAPIVALPLLAASAAWMLAVAAAASGPAQAWSPVAAAAMMGLLPLVGMIGPARAHETTRVAAEALRATIMVEGLMAIAEGRSPRAVEERVRALILDLPAREPKALAA